MKNKNSLYIVLGVGLGVVAYYVFCKNKTKKTSKISEEEPIKEANKPSINIPKYVTPIATTTPFIVNVTTNKPTSTPEVKPVISSSPAPAPAPSPAPAPAPVPKPEPTPVIVASTTPTSVKTDLAPISIQPRDIKSSFQGVGQQCFEVGDCLSDL
jgi:hypothetical protein